MSKIIVRDPAELEVLVHLGARIQEERRRVSLTQRGLAQALRLSTAYVSLIERGGRNPPYATVAAIARALQTSVASLVEGPGQADPSSQAA